MRTTFIATALALLAAVSAESKTQVYKGAPSCQIASRGSASLKRAIQGVAYLGGKGTDTVTLGPGPGECSRVSCSYKTAINVCNDDSKDVTLALTNIGAVALDVANQCNQGQGNDFNGQEFNTSDYAGGWNWNVIIEAADC